MSMRPRTHRASAQRRRTALLEAAAELSAEVGAGAVTHRAVAARAGVPLSTTSYFFASIHDLVHEALASSVERREAALDEVQAAAFEASDRAAIGDVIEAVVATTIAIPRERAACEVEHHLAAGRHPELRADATAMVERAVAQAQGLLAAEGAAQPEGASRALVALADGAMLHRAGGLDLDHEAELRTGLRLVLAAAQLTEPEVDALLARYDERAAPPS